LIAGAFRGHTIRKQFQFCGEAFRHGGLKTLRGSHSFSAEARRGVATSPT
jgi:hypothetical protein